MSSDNAFRTARDVRFRPAGAGMGSQLQFCCMGCGKQRPTLNSKGPHGALKRCAVCLAAKAAKGRAA